MGALALLFGVVSTVGCGQRGPLFLDDRSAAASSPAAAVPLPPPPVRP